MESILATLRIVTEVAQLAFRVGENVAPYFKMISKLVKKEPLSQEEYDSLTADRKRLSATLQEPLPPEQA